MSFSLCRGPLVRPEVFLVRRASVNHRLTQFQRPITRYCWGRPQIPNSVYPQSD
jgi:hypothetical protein